MDEQTARSRQAQDGWQVMEDAGRGWRRVVASPLPKEIVEIDAIRRLSDDGYVVVACGGGGIPVVHRPDGTLEGVEAVIDKDYASSLLARTLHARYFLISTGVEQVSLHYKKPHEQKLARITISEARQYIKAGHFGKGSMLPKIEAALAFIDGGGHEAVITHPSCLLQALRGQTGTRIVCDP